MGVYHQIKDKFIMRNARADWAPYRTQLTDLILQMYPDSVMIVGAGRCNDIDLGRLVGAGAEKCNDNDPGRCMSEGVRRVVLLDVDTDGMQEAAASLPEEQRSKLELRTGSLTGISEDDMEAFCDRMLSYVRSAGRDLSVESVRRELMREMDNLKGRLESKQESSVDSELDRERDREKENRSDSERESEQESKQESKQESGQENEPAEGVSAMDALYPESCSDIVVCCGVHSQLFSTLSFFVRSLIHSLQDILPGVEEMSSCRSIRWKGRISAYWMCGNTTGRRRRI